MSFSHVVRVCVASEESTLASGESIVEVLPAEAGETRKMQINGIPVRHPPSQSFFLFSFEG